LASLSLSSNSNNTASKGIQLVELYKPNKTFKDIFGEVTDAEYGKGLATASEVSYDNI
jgi:hypothetical protein